MVKTLNELIPGVVKGGQVIPKILVQLSSKYGQKKAEKIKSLLPGMITGMLF